MAAYFSAERVQELLAGQHQVHLHFTDLREVEGFSGLIVGQQPNDHAIVITSGRKPVGGLHLAAERFRQFGRRRAAILRVLGHRLHRRVTVFEHCNSDASGVGGEADMPRQPNRRD